MEQESKEFSLKKFLFGKINRKLAIGFALIALLIIVVSQYAIIISESALLTSIGTDSELLAQNSINAVDRIIYRRLELWRSYIVSRPELILELKKSNNEFEQIKNVQQFIITQDKNWINTSMMELNPLMEKILFNNLSYNLKQKIDFYNKNYDHIVFPEVFITNKFGVNIALSTRTSDYYQADEFWWQKTKEEGIYVSDLIFDESTNTYSMDLGIRINDENGNFLGILVAALNIDEIIQIITDLPDIQKKYKSLHFELINSKKQLIYSTRDFNVFDDVSNKLKISGQTGYYVQTYLKSGEKEELFAYSKSLGYKDYISLGWVLFVEYETDELFLPIIKLKQSLLLVSMIIVVLAISIGFYFSRSITQPLNQLYLGVTELEKGNFNTKVHIKSGDEIEELGNNFNKTAKALSKLDEEHKEIDKAKTRFLSITSHELRSPMTPMRAQLQMLEKGYFGKLNNNQKDSVDVVLRNTIRLDNIIKDFLEISRIEAARLKFRFEKTNLESHIKRVVDSMEWFMPEKNAKIILKMDKLPTIEVDPDRTMQVLRNLLNNAIKFCYSNCKVEVIVKRAKNHILFSVKDNGIGMSEIVKSKIFEPFYQGEETMYRKHSGSGLGLAICKGIVESQNGKIWVESEKNKGSIFYFTVPLKPVKKIKPIKLMFSERAVIEKKVKQLFIDVLGPIGKTEFFILKKNKQITKESVKEYLNLLIDKGILNKNKIEEFKNKISLIFIGE